MGIILISDEPEEIAANCNRVIVMYEGAVVATVSEEDRNTPGFVERLARMISEPDQARKPRTADDSREVEPA